jgi:hypothetical protein
MMSLIHYVCPQCTAVNRVESSRLTESPKCGKCHQGLMTHLIPYLKYKQRKSFVSSDTGLDTACLIMLARFHAIAVDPNKLPTNLKKQANCLAQPKFY